MKKAIAALFAALLIVPAVASAEGTIGFGLTTEYSPLFFHKSHVIDIESGTDSDYHEFDINDVHWVDVQGELTFNFGRGLLYFPVGYENCFGRLKNETTNFADRAGVDFTGEGWEDFSWQMIALGFGGGGNLPLIDNDSGQLRIVIRGQVTGSAGVYERADFQSDGALGIAGGVDCALRYYFGRPTDTGTPTGFYIGGGLGGRYIHRRADVEDNHVKAKFRLGGSVGSVVIQLGWGG